MEQQYKRQIVYSKPPGRKNLDGTDPGEQKDKTVFLQIPVTASQKAAFAKQCAVAGISMSEAIRTMIDEFINSWILPIDKIEKP